MTPRQRLYLAGFFFLAWIGYLAYLVSITREPVVLSRPQFLVADLYVLAELGAAKEDEDVPISEVKIVEVAWPANFSKLAGETILVKGLDLCTTSNGWVGPGTYILPLTKGPKQYALTEIPPSPGFYVSDKLHNNLRIYHVTPEAQHQLRTLITEFHPQAGP